MHGVSQGVDEGERAQLSLSRVHSLWIAPGRRGFLTHMPGSLARPRPDDQWVHVIDSRFRIRPHGIHGAIDRYEGPHRRHPFALTELRAPTERTLHRCGLNSDRAVSGSTPR